MLADEYDLKLASRGFPSAGKLDATALACISRDAVLDAIEGGLADIAGRKEFRNIKNEKGITNRLCKILSGHKLLYFHHEGMQDEETGGSASVDVEAIATTQTVFEARLFAREHTLMAIEAKRLPAPPPRQREREYLVGHDKPSGGIERFKLGIHGKHSAAWTMLGYVQEGGFKSWRARINDWIDDLSKMGKPDGFWGPGEKLEMVADTAITARCLSNHKRQLEGKPDTIQIAHLWVLLNQGAG
ncbi:MAG: hypothetical protein ACLQM8_10790 [Limisphaerales bacterium]